MPFIIKPTRLLSTVLLTLAGCAAEEPRPLVTEPTTSACKDGSCTLTVSTPCQRGHAWDVIQFGSTMDDVGVAVATDEQCNIYVAGNTRGLIEGRSSSSQPGLMMDMFLARIPSVMLDGTGYPFDTWMTQIGSAADDSVKDLTVSPAGNAYVVGSTGGLMPGEASLLGNLGFNDIFATKFSPAGDKLWMKQYGSEEEDVGIAATLTRSEELLIAGTTQENFDMGFEVTLDTLNSSGVLGYRYTYGTGNHDRGEGISLDTSGNIYLAGSTLGDFAQANQGSTDVFVSRLAPPDQKVEWTSQLGTSDIDAALEVAVDAAGNVYALAVSFSDLESGRFENDGIQNSFLIKYPSGSDQPEWIRRIGSNRDYNRSTGLVLDTNGNVFVAGFTTGAMEDGKQNKGGRDAYVAMFNPSGTKIWARQLGTTGNDEAQDVALTLSGDVVITGYTSGDLTGQGQHRGRQDGFVARFGPPAVQQ